MAVQAGLVANREARNKRAREEVARVYYEVSSRCGSLFLRLIAFVSTDDP